MLSSASTVFGQSHLFPVSLGGSLSVTAVRTPGLDGRNGGTPSGVPGRGGVPALVANGTGVSVAESMLPQRSRRRSPTPRRRPS